MHPQALSMVTQKFPLNENNRTDHPIFYAATKKSNEVMAILIHIFINCRVQGGIFTVYGPLVDLIWLYLNLLKI